MADENQADNEEQQLSWLQKIFGWCESQPLIMKWWFFVVMVIIAGSSLLGVATEMVGTFDSYLVSSFVFEKAIALVIFMAFYSSYRQFPGLISSSGITPTHSTIRRALSAQLPSPLFSSSLMAQFKDPTTNQFVANSDANVSLEKTTGSTPVVPPTILSRGSTPVATATTITTGSNHYFLTIDQFVQQNLNEEQRQYFKQARWELFWKQGFPTLLLWDDSDQAVRRLHYAGLAASALLFTGALDFAFAALVSPFLTPACFASVLLSVPTYSLLALVFSVNAFLLAAICYPCYLSIRTVSKVWMRLQFDSFLLETTLFAALTSLILRLSILSGASRIVSQSHPQALWNPGDLEPVGSVVTSTAAEVILALACVRFVLFKITFASGIVKLTSGDTSWRDGTAMSYHYLSQPIPNPLSYYFHLKVPPWAHSLSQWAHFVIELASPFLFFWPWGLPRFLATIAVCGFHLMIWTTGNYGFFSANNVAIALTLVADTFIPSSLRSWLLPDLVATVSQLLAAHSHDPTWSAVYFKTAALLLRLACAVLVAVGYLFVLGLGLAALNCAKKQAYRYPPQLLAQLERYLPTIFRIQNLFYELQPWHVSGAYGLFAVMTKGRIEVIMQGSMDGELWHPICFRYKPSHPNDHPKLMWFFLSRLDWWLWFCQWGALPPWVTAFMTHLLKGTPAVYALLAPSPPFSSDNPPKYLRVTKNDYQFDASNQKWYLSQELQTIYRALALIKSS